MPEAVDTPRGGRASASFTQRLRCTQVRLYYRRLAGPDVLRLLCERRPLAVLKIEAPLAESGDPRAIELIGLLANGGKCDLLGASRASPVARTRLLAVAEQNGATPRTLHRLDELLADDEKGPTAEELEGCRQSAAELERLRPGLLQQAVRALGRSVEALRGENGLDIGIEYSRRMLVQGDAASEESLAHLLLQKDTPDSQAEAVRLLRDAAQSSPSAKSELARCLLQGCPTPAPDFAEARQLLIDAAEAGDLGALMTVAGQVELGATDLDLLLPATDRYAWDELLQRLHEEGCFGATDYSAWATFPHQPGNLLAMSPADAAAAQARSAELLAEQLPRTRALLGCD